MINETLNPFHPNKVLLYQPRLTELAQDHITAPVTVEVDLTDEACNQKCGHCSFGSGIKNKMRMIDQYSLSTALKEAYQIGSKGVELVGGGEPTSHPKISEIIIDTKKIGLDVGLITNGVLLDRVFDSANLLRFVRISLDSANQATYDLLHGVQGQNHFQKVLNNIRGIRDRMTPSQHSDLALGIGYLVVPPYNNSRDEIFDGIELAKDLGVDYIVFRPAQLKQTRTAEQWEEAQETINYARNNNRGRKLEIFGGDGIRWDILTQDKHPEGMCNSKPLVAVIQANGDIAWCILHRNNTEMKVGNIYNGSFSEQWFNDRHLQAWKAFNVSECPTPCKHYAYSNVIRYRQAGNPINVVDNNIGHPNHI